MSGSCNRIGSNQQLARNVNLSKATGKDRNHNEYASDSGEPSCLFRIHRIDSPTHAVMNPTYGIAQGFVPKNVALNIVLNTDSAAASGSSLGMVILK